MNDKEIFAKNLQYYMDLNNKTRKDVSDALNISYYTLTDWVKAKKYPRMDKVQMLADYFGVLKSDLIEESTGNPVEQAIFEAKVLKDKELMDMVKLYMNLSETKKRAVRQMVETLSAD